jgi:hypothetical protein
MRDAVLTFWPDAPISDASADGRWVRIRPPDGRIVYVQRYAWDEQSRPDYLVVIHAGAAEGEQRRFGSLAEAVEHVRAAVSERVA